MTSTDEDPLLSRLRTAVQNSILRREYDSAEFWSEKCLILSGSTFDIYWLLQTFLLSQQYQRTVAYIERHNLLCKDVVFRYQAALCQYESGKYPEAIGLLDCVLPDVALSVDPKTPVKSSIENLNFPGINAAIELLKGKTLEALNNRERAAECYINCLHDDPFCYEALNLLLGHHILPAEREQTILEGLSLSSDQCPKENKLLEYLFSSRLGIGRNLESGSFLSSFEASKDVLISKAERLFKRHMVKDALQITNQVLENDPFDLSCLTIHIALLAEVKHTNELFRIAHELVDTYPEKAISWYAVGTYYYLIGRHEQARTYLSKATKLDGGLFGPGWICYGHAFAADGEHDQAMAAYFSASQVMAGSHLPFLYVGLEYGKTYNIRLAEKFLIRAKSMNPDDLTVLHELAYILIQDNQLQSAESHLLSALDIINRYQNDESGKSFFLSGRSVEPVYNNLGHLYRLTKAYDKSIDYHMKALAVDPQNASTLASIGFVYSLKGELFTAVDFLHKSLSLKQDDSFVCSLLSAVGKELSASNYVLPVKLVGAETLPDCPDPLPKFVYDKPLLGVDSAMPSLNESNHSLSAGTQSPKDLTAQESSSVMQMDDSSGSD